MRYSSTTVSKVSPTLNHIFFNYLHEEAAKSIIIVCTLHEFVSVYIGCNALVNYFTDRRLLHLLGREGAASNRSMSSRTVAYILLT